MTPELQAGVEKIIPVDLPGFWKLVVDEFKNTPTVRNIETIAENLVKKEGMEKFAVEMEAIREKIHKFVGDEKWEKIEEEEGNRYLKNDRGIVGATAG